MNVAVLDRTERRELLTDIHVIADQFNEVFKAQSGCLQDRPQALEGEIDLLFCRVRYGAVRAHADLAGDEQQTTCRNGRRIVERFEHLGAAEDRVRVRQGDGRFGSRHGGHRWPEEAPILAWLAHLRDNRRHLPTAAARSPSCPS